MTANSFTANDPDDLWCVDHNTYTDRCLYLHDRANSDALPDPWLDALRSGLKNDPDLFDCDVCGAEKPRDEMHHGTWAHVGEVYFCDACASRP